MKGAAWLCPTEASPGACLACFQILPPPSLEGRRIRDTACKQRTARAEARGLFPRPQVPP
ncbi:hypothetical protein EI555_007806 [Monodon monoceros]|uniref:Uncharacterized protein n=1 Tax=Monodon monoceros TaxID=40151 RepID=A0A4U1ERI2_MONMO|nr:hypothetical protein EI555_007806 [Monodon monoceros]